MAARLALFAALVGLAGCAPTVARGAHHSGLEREPGLANAQSATPVEPLGPSVPASGSTCDEPNWPVRACEGAAEPERVGLWSSDSHSFVFDGCTVTYVAPDDRAVTHYCGNGLVSGYTWQTQFGDPAPVFRARARWAGSWLMVDTSVETIRLAKWSPDAFVFVVNDGAGRESTTRTRRVESIAELGRVGWLLVCAQRIEPTLAELVAEFGEVCSPP